MGEAAFKIADAHCWDCGELLKTGKMPLPEHGQEFVCSHCGALLVWEGSADNGSPQKPTNLTADEAGLARDYWRYLRRNQPADQGDEG